MSNHRKCVSQYIELKVLGVGFRELSHLTRYLSQAEQNAQNDNYFVQNG